MVGACALLAPTLGTAQDDGPATTTIELRPYGGGTRYVDCDGTHHVVYGGLGADARFRQRDSPIGVRGAGAAGYIDDENDAGRHRGFFSGGALVQATFDWEYVGFALGLGLTMQASDDQFGALPLIPATLRVGPLDGPQLRVGFLDEVPIERGVFWGALAWADREVGELELGLREHGFSENPSVTLGGRIVLSPVFRLGGRIDFSLVEDALLPQGELLVSYDLQ